MSAPYAWAVDGRTLRRLPAPVDTPPCGDSTVVEIRYTGVCGSDVAKLTRPWQGRLPEPWYPGHEIVGIDTDSGQWGVVDPRGPPPWTRRRPTGPPRPATPPSPPLARRHRSPPGSTRRPPPPNPL